ncbi:hypothetical protein M8C13_06170 [Crossiella sp. SN42]|uniref:hypothetical protein n=1 Tax=Crossiella sp. SN42 TaxID=2944808 RepID=UPI00207D58CA|nr:hypothetical protein [Crossiella sp. SN42]MCO1575345.1 hypothetical protein [Crossiella sp. SN42]
MRIYGQYAEQTAWLNLKEIAYAIEMDLRKVVNGVIQTDVMAVKDRITVLLSGFNDSDIWDERLRLTTAARLLNARVLAVMGAYNWANLHDPSDVRFIMRVELENRRGASLLITSRPFGS